ncbi:Stress induced protein [Melia azedarach]|uniref:Stress induced protein n=1 Tax=Melia azedarach TaxID=155640 RepID=A0ACC1XE52_MELAZ|nr:Stress induced protein [Melia azedarach]
MANFKEKVTLMSPLRENEQEGQDFDDYENTNSRNGCNCFGFFCFRTGNETKSLLQGREYGEAWWNEKLNKVKEVSELCAGPKWKNFIRKVGRFFSFKRNKHYKFQYDAQSYALNFDSGVDREDVAFAS